MARRENRRDLSQGKIVSVCFLKKERNKYGTSCIVLYHFIGMCSFFVVHQYFEGKKVV